MTLAKNAGARVSVRVRPSALRLIVCLLVGHAAVPELVAAAPPAVSVSSSAAPAASCDEAQVSVGVQGVGDPVTQRRPLDVMVVLDRSGSMDDAGWFPPQPLTDAKSGAKALVDVLSTAEDRAGVTAFSDTGTLNRSLTSNFTSVKNAIDGLSAGGATNMARGVQTGQADLAANGRGAPAVRVMVVLGDGVPTRRLNGNSCPNSPSAPNNCTQDAIDQAAAAKAAGTVIFTIGLNLTNLPPATETVARSTLQGMASNAGAYFESPTSAELAGIFAEIGEIVTTLAGSDLVLTHVLPGNASYVSGSAVPAPTSVSGQTLIWNLGLLNIGSSSGVTFRVRIAPPLPNQPVVASPGSRIDYLDYLGAPATAAVPPATVSVAPCATPTPTRTDTPGPTHTPPPTGTATATSTPEATATATATPAPFCGDGTLDPDEHCDDGNGFDGDGCESDCTLSTACATLDYPAGERFVGACGAPSHASIQEAVDAASDGETISVCPGTYTDPVLVTREVRIRAAVPDSVTVQTAGTAFDVRRSGVAIEGLTIHVSSGAAITASALCPLGQASCASPGYGSNLRVEQNTISDSPLAIGWSVRVDCADIIGNTLADNDTHIDIRQADGPAARLVGITANRIVRGGSTGAAVALAGIGATIAANTIADSGTAGLVLAAMSDGSQVIENGFANNAGDGITLRPGTTGVRVHDNNITDNTVGLGNESGGLIDARENWWDSQRGPSGVTWPNPDPGPPLTGSGDLIVNRDGTTVFVEFLCKPFPQGFPSVLGQCGTEVAELRQLLPGRAPDLDPFGRYIVFESTADMNVDGRTTFRNDDASQEIFLLNRRPKKSLTGVCLGGLVPCDFRNLASCTPCNGKSQCPGDPSADPIVLNGECVVVTQLTDGDGETQSRGPRLTGLAKHVVFDSDNQQAGNPDGSREILRWSRPSFEKLEPPLASYSSGSADEYYQNPAPALNGKYIAVESNANPTGHNADGNTEIFVYKPRSGEWLQITHTLPPVENLRPATVDGRRIVFDSTGDLHNDAKVPGIGNADGNRELFMARVKTGAVEIRQITDTHAPAETHSGSVDANSALVAFSSTGDLTGQNADGTREIFTWHRRTGLVEQLTHATAGESTNPVVNLGQRFVVFESTADLTSSGATNRRIFQFDRVRGELLLLSRSRFGTNRTPRIRKRRYVVWESTSNLTGNNPTGEQVIYLFDRKKD